jgi:hypothetical protein
MLKLHTARAGGKQLLSQSLQSCGSLNGLDLKTELNTGVMSVPISHSLYCMYCTLMRLIIYRIRKLNSKS